ncbi:MAG: cupin domain-containing protein [Candidatus Dojkabacteria bacterium]
MNTSTIKKTIEINASSHNVWKVLTNPIFMTAWTYENMEGTTVEGEPRMDGSYYFKDKTGQGLRAKVSVFLAGQNFKYHYVANIVDGREERESNDYKEWAECYDNYVLTENNDVTTFDLESKNPSKYDSMFDEMWDKNLEKIKQFAEDLQTLEEEGYGDLTAVNMPFGKPEHTHDNETVHIILLGDLHTSEKGEEKTFSPGDKVVFPAGTTHTANADDTKGIMIVGFKK